MAGIIKDQRGILLEVGGMPDHVHLVVRIRPDLAVAELVRLVKTNASKWVNERKDLTPCFAWQAGYGAFAISPSQLATAMLSRPSGLGMALLDHITQA